MRVEGGCAQQAGGARPLLSPGPVEEAKLIQIAEYRPLPGGKVERV